MVQALHQTHGRHRAWDALAQTGPQSWFGFRLLFDLSLGAAGFIQATRVIVWVGKDRATARGSRVLLWASHLIEKTSSMLQARWTPWALQGVWCLCARLCTRLPWRLLLVVVSTAAGSQG
jgi:hypothetical protein